MTSFSYIDEKYIKQLSMYTNRFREVGNGTYNVRCFLCGDSEKSAIKARGYFYKTDKNSWRYKCHNCAANISLAKALKELSPSLYDEYRFEYFKENGGEVHEKKLPKKEIAETVFKPTNTKDKLLTNTILSEMKTISSLDSCNPGYKYIMNRSIPLEKMDKLFFTDSLQDIVKHIPAYQIDKVPKMSGIIIPYFSDDGILENFQIRNIDPISKMRYLTYDITEKPSHVYNLENVVSGIPVYVFEGAFDSMFCENGVAASGSSIFQKLSKIKEKNKDVVVVFDNDYKTNKEILKLLNDVIERGYSVVLFDSEMNGYKDINAFAKAKNKNKKEITEYLQKCTYSEMAAKFVLANQRKNRGSISWVNDSTDLTVKQKQSKTKRKSELQAKRKNSVFTI